MNLKSSISRITMTLMVLLSSMGLFVTTGHTQNLDWYRSFAATYTQSGYDVCQMADRGFAIAGESYTAESGDQAWIGKTDPDGYLEWSRTLGGTSYGNEARAVIETYDGGIVVAGSWNTTDSGSQCFMAKYSTSGTLQWARRYGGTGYDVAYDVAEASDGSLLMVGRTNSFDTSNNITNAYLVKVDAQGDFKWQKFYGGSMYTVASSVIETSDGGYAITGRQAIEVEAPEAVWLCKIDADGDSLWAERHLDWDSGYNRPNGIVETENGGLAIAGQAEVWGDSGFEAIFLLRTDADGDSLGLDYFEGEISYSASGCLDLTDDGGFVIAGYKYPGGDYYNPRAYILRLDATGDSLWAETYGGSSYDYAYGVIQDHVGGYVAVGQTSSYSEDQDVYLFRVQREQPRTLHVKDDYATIQEAINESIPGDTILVESGTYRGDGNRDIYVYNGWFVLKSEDGPNRTVIDLQGSSSSQHRFLYMDYYTTNHSLIEIEGFTIKNGYESGDGDYGGAMYLYGASPTIRDCVFDNHSGSAFRIADYASPVFENCRFTDNSGTYGGAVNLRQYATATFNTCSFENNSAGYGGAIYTGYDAYLYLTNCTFINNSSGKGGSIYFTGLIPVAPEEDPRDHLDIDAGDHRQAADGPSEFLLERSLITGTQQGAPVLIQGEAALTVRCNDIYGNAAGDWIGPLASYLGMNGNISADPLFCDPLGGSLTVTANSPLTAENSPCGAIGYGEVGCGAIEIALTPSALTFADDYGSENPAPVTVAIDNLGGNILGWTAEESSSIVSMTSMEGTAPDSFDVSVDYSGLDPGTYVDTIIVYGDNAVNSPAYLPVTISIIPTNPPVFDSVVTSKPVIEGDTSWIVAHHNETVNIDFWATDADGTIPTFTSLERPTGSVFLTLGTPGVVRVSWNPVTATSGLHYVTVEAADDWLADTITVAVVINNPPAFVAVCPDTSIMEGQTLAYTMVASDDVDPLDDAVAWSMFSTAGIGSLVDNGDGTADFSLTPDFSYVGQQLQYDIQAGDDYGSSGYRLYIDVTNRALTVLSMEPIPGGNSDLLIDETIQVQFSEPIEETSLASGLQITTAKGDVLDYSYDAEQAFVLIDGGTDLLRPLDTITITLTTDVVDLSGIALDAPYSGTFYTGTVVYPGDANNDGIVDERDILPIGLYWGNEGPVRPNASLSFERLPAHVFTPGNAWTPLGGVYADADGSGVVDADDICGVADNWDLTHTVGAPEKGAAVEMAAGVEESVLLQLYAAIIDCPQSEGRSAIEGMLVSALGGAAEVELPTTVQLSQNYPNPFNPSTTIRFYLPEAGTVSLSVYNIVGQRVANLIDGTVNSGYSEILWDGASDAGTPVASGIYFYRLDTPEGSITKRMMLLK